MEKKKLHQKLLGGLDVGQTEDFQKIVINERSLHEVVFAHCVNG